jgi:phosphotransferase system IIB component
MYKIGVIYMFLTTLLSLPLIIGGALLVLVAALIIILVLVKGKKNKRIKIDSKFIDSLFTILGGKENILEVLVDNARLKFKVNNLEKVDLNALKSLSNQGVFVTGDYIKTLFKFDSKDIMKAMKERM